MENWGNSLQDTRPGMGHRGHSVGGNRMGEIGAFGHPPFHCQFESRGGPQFQGARGGGRRFEQRDHRGRGFDGPNRF
jgi:hypothetical protein